MNINSAYSILNIEPGVSKALIKKAYLKMARKYHPDSVKKDTLIEKNKVKIEDINEAYNVILDSLNGVKKLYKRNLTDEYPTFKKTDIDSILNKSTNINFDIFEDFKFGDEPKSSWSKENKKIIRVKSYLTHEDIKRSNKKVLFFDNRNKAMSIMIDVPTKFVDEMTIVKEFDDFDVYVTLKKE